MKKIMSLFTIFCLTAAFMLPTAYAEGAVNIALGKPIKVSSTLCGSATSAETRQAMANRLVDGIKVDNPPADSPQWANLSLCADTRFEGDQWFVIDLGAVYALDTIVLYAPTRNQDGWAKLGFSNLKVMGGTDSQLSNGYKGSLLHQLGVTPNYAENEAAFSLGMSYTIDLSSASENIRYIAVNRNVADKYLALIEIEAFGSLVPENLVKGLPNAEFFTGSGSAAAAATMYSNGGTAGSYDGYYGSHKAVNGNPNDGSANDPSGAIFFQGYNGKQVTLRWDLGAVYPFTSARLVGNNSASGSSDAQKSYGTICFSNIELYVSDIPLADPTLFGTKLGSSGTFDGYPDSGPNQTTLTPAAGESWSGRYVYLVKNITGSGYNVGFCLNELELFGFREAIDSEAISNVALKKTVDYSNKAASPIGGPGGTNGYQNWAPGIVNGGLSASTDGSGYPLIYNANLQYYTIDLGNVYDVESISIFCPNLADSNRPHWFSFLNIYGGVEKTAAAGGQRITDMTLLGTTGDRRTSGVAQKERVDFRLETPGAYRYIFIQKDAPEGASKHLCFDEVIVMGRGDIDLSDLTLSGTLAEGETVTATVARAKNYTESDVNYTLFMMAYDVNNVMLTVKPATVTATAGASSELSGTLTLPAGTVRVEAMLVAADGAQVIDAARLS